MKNRGIKLLLSRINLLVGACLLTPLAAFALISNRSSADTPVVSLGRTVVALSGIVAAWLFIRALSSRIPMFGKPYYSDDGTLSAMMKDRPRDLSIPWIEVLVLSVEFILFAILWFLAIRR